MCHLAHDFCNKTEREVKISNFIKSLREYADRYFPDRQLIFRTNGDVRFLSITQNMQIFACSVVMCFFIWMAVTSYNYVYVNEILNDKDSEVDQVNRNYDELESQFTQLKNDIEKSAAALEQRQVLIDQLMDENVPATNTPSIPVSEGTETTDDGDQNDGDKEARNNIRGEKLDQIYVGLKRLEIKQNKVITALSNKIDQNLSFVKETFEKAGIGEKQMLALAETPSIATAQGGPVEALPEGMDPELVINSKLDELYSKNNELKSLELAIAFLPTAAPPEKYYISSKFGVRRDPFTKAWTSHKGLDMAGWHKTPINASGDGVVTKAGRNGTFGLFIEIDHGNGFRSRYGHLSKLHVKRGDKVKTNQLIGLMGSTGRSVSTHLHYEIWFNGKPIDPLKVIKAAEDVQKIKQRQYNS